MAFTRFHDDPARIKKSLEESTFTGRYQLDTPGPGAHLPFWEDPNIRLQSWGANLHRNTVDLESDFRGLTRPLNRDILSINQYQNYAAQTVNPNNYGHMNPFVEESRASHPAWMYKDITVERWEEPWINPQSVGIDAPFHQNINTRILEKDNFVPLVPKYT